MASVGGFERPLCAQVHLGAGAGAGGRSREHRVEETVATQKATWHSGVCPLPGSAWPKNQLPCLEKLPLHF